MSGLSISSAEFQRAFGRYREAALKQPVTITNHGRASLVLMGVDEYQRLKARDRVALKVDDLSDEAFRAITEQELPAELARFDHELGGKP
ncbi:MAG: type II toxin-antitoxin system prevent-host-death family antitoxin [Caulobacter sp.]|nr:type II toxin-antitoxin system prevent-host-death family antitoxin [Caulobacter sp.]